MIYGIDTKTCTSCGDEKPIEQFIRKFTETSYCEECRKVCETCGEWIAICGGGDHEDDIRSGMYRDEWRHQAAEAQRLK